MAAGPTVPHGCRDTVVGPHMHKEVPSNDAHYFTPRV